MELTKIMILPLTPSIFYIRGTIEPVPSASVHVDPKKQGCAVWQNATKDDC
jgi:hypothetical protein